MKDQKRQSRLKILFAAVMLVAVVVTAIAAVWMRNRGQTEKTSTSAQTQDEEKWQEGVISYNGKYYKYNNYIKSYLFLGVDKSGTMEDAQTTEGGNAGQTDVMFLLVQDKKNETLSAIAINRNTMAEIYTYDVNGQQNGTTTAQICLQHTYGDGGRMSCRYTVEAVERLFYNIPISGYYAMTMDGIPILNDALGGITVTVLDDLSDASRGVSLKKGETKTLNGQEAYVYIRSRDVNEFNSATERLERHKQYIEALMERVRQMAQSSKSEALNVYNQLEDYCVTNMSVGDLVLELSDYTYSGQMYSLPGEMVMGQEYEEYYVDDEDLYQLMIDIFYEEVPEEEVQK